MSHPNTHPSDGDPQPGHRFTLQDEPPSAGESISPRRDFEPDLPSQPATESPTRTERDLENSLMRPRKRRWGLAALLGGGLALGTAELAVTLPATLTEGDWLAGGWQLLGLAAIALGATALGRELWRLRRLHRHDRLRGELAQLNEADAPHAMTQAHRLKQQMGLDDDHPHWVGFRDAVAPHHGGDELRELLAHHLLSPRDREARRLISKMSSETAVMVAVSPLTLVDMALVAWRNLAMVDRVCRLYGLELGYASRLRLLRSVLYNMAFAGVSEMASEAGMEMLSLDLASRLSTRAGQGLGIGLLSARLGLRTQRLTRPIAFADDEAPRIGDLRRELWQQLRRLEVKERHADAPDP